MGIPDHLTCILRYLYADEEATVRTGHGTTDCFQIGKGVCHGCILSPCLFNLYAEYIMRNAGLEKAQAGIKTATRNIHNLRYADDTTLMAESEEKLKSLLMKVKSEREVAQSCPTLGDPMNCSLPGSSAHGILQARILEWVAVPSSRPRDPTYVSMSPTLAGRFFTTSATSEALLFEGGVSASTWVCSMM